MIPQIEAETNCSLSKIRGETKKIRLIPRTEAEMKCSFTTKAFSGLH